MTPGKIIAEGTPVLILMDDGGEPEQAAVKWCIDQLCAHCGTWVYVVETHARQQLFCCGAALREVTRH